MNDTADMFEPTQELYCLNLPSRQYVARAPEIHLVRLGVTCWKGSGHVATKSTS